jgi:hypothetical protein
MKLFPYLSASRRLLGVGRRLACALFLAGLVTLPLSAADDTSNEVAVTRPTFTLKYPSDWKIDSAAKDYNADNNFTLNSGGNSYVQFNISTKAGDLQKVLDNAVFNLDGLAITTLSKSPFTQWGAYSGLGLHLKGKILDSYPGGIRVFVFNTNSHNVMVVEFYYSNELSQVQGELDFISQSFKMTD